MKISIVVPVYNVEQFIYDCLDSIKNQIYTDFECIMVDDGSTDGCAKICDEYMHSDKRFKAFHKVNGGLVSARKFGVNKASGEYVCFVDSDDFISESYIATFADIIEKHAPDIVANNYLETYTDKKSYPFYLDVYSGLFCDEQLDKIKNRLLYDDSIGKKNMGAIFPSLCLKCIKRELLEQQYRDCIESIAMGEDLMITAPIALYCNSIYIDCFKGYFYRKNNNSIVNTFKPEYFDNLDKLTSYLLDKMPDHKQQILRYGVLILEENIISAAKSVDNSKEFLSLIKSKLTSDVINKYKKINIMPFGLKMKILFFLIKSKMWSLLYLIIRIY